MEVGRTILGCKRKTEALGISHKARCGQNGRIISRFVRLSQALEHLCGITLNRPAAPDRQMSRTSGTNHHPSPLHSQAHFIPYSASLISSCSYGAPKYETPANPHPSFTSNPQPPPHGPCIEQGRHAASPLSPNHASRFRSRGCVTRVA
jgi:hypothetical protein